MRSSIDFLNKKMFFNKAEKDLYNYFVEFCKQKEFDDSLYYKFGYEVFGIILLGFTKWLRRELINNEQTDVYFFSRDGKLLKKAFDILNTDNIINTYYLYVSRRSLRVPLLNNSSLSKLEAIKPTKYVSFYDLFDSIGLDPLDYELLVEEKGYTLNSVIKDIEIETNENVKDIINVIWKDVELVSAKEASNAEMYLSKFVFNKKTAVVDIGWRGSIQFYFEQLLKKMNINTEVNGYYVNLSSDMYKTISMKSYLGNCNQNSEGCDVLRGYVGLFEFFFMNEDGTTLNYEYVDREIKPCLAPCEYKDSMGNLAELDYIKEIQTGALDFIEDVVVTNSKLLYEDFSSYFAFYNMNYCGNHPNKIIFNMFKDMRFFNNGTFSCISGEKPSLRNLVSFKNMKNQLYKSRWRIGFLKRYIIIPFPSYLLFKILMLLAH